MNTKLTLTIEEAVIEKAKKYASEKGNSLSGIIENYLKMITEDQPSTEAEITPLVHSLKGAFKAPADFDYKEELTEALSRKHL